MLWSAALAVGHVTVMDVVVIMPVAQASTALPLFKVQESRPQYFGIFALVLPGVSESIGSRKGSRMYLI